jgi:glutamate-ammonia-ligase adenylyltransferase
LDAKGFAVIGYGKLGWIELGYGSDLDLVFIHALEEQSETDGKKSISGAEFAIRVAQKFMSLMTTQTLDGRVYEIDTRLTTIR